MFKKKKNTLRLNARKGPGRRAGTRSTEGEKQEAPPKKKGDLREKNELPQTRLDLRLPRQGTYEGKTTGRNQEPGIPRQDSPMRGTQLLLEKRGTNRDQEVYLKEGRGIREAGKRGARRLCPSIAAVEAALARERRKPAEIG